MHLRYTIHRPSHAVLFTNMRPCYTTFLHNSASLLNTTPHFASCTGLCDSEPRAPSLVYQSAEEPCSALAGLCQRGMPIPGLVADWLAVTTLESSGTKAVTDFAVRLSHGVALWLEGCSICPRSEKRGKKRGRDSGTATVGFTTVYGSNVRMNVLLLWIEYLYVRVIMDELSFTMTGIYTMATPYIQS
jgi:hypothetical protein